MPSTRSIVKRLSVDYPGVNFISGTSFFWSPSNNTVHYNEKDPSAPQLLLHELSHNLLGHSNYHRDVELLAIEAAAWQHADSFAKQYDVQIDANLMEDHLDTYRDWLHARSTCPTCEATGYQTSPKTYFCPACLHEWRVNEARTCALRRYKQNNPVN